MTDAPATSPAATVTSAGSPFWRFSLGFYRVSGVADACIRLQEEAGIDVNLLLFLLWHATHRRALAAAEVAALEDRVAPWRETIVIPLRRMRRALKAPPALVAAAEAEAFRNRIKAVELEAERLQQEAMHELTRAALLGQDAPSTEAAARASIASYASIARTKFPPTAVETLLAALPRDPP
jgi:uncharacterized protein (TIGR02444 family)